MNVSLIATMSKHRVIGKDNNLTSHIPQDLKWFLKHTRNKPVIMGRKTWQSLPKKPLPNRYNIVLTSNKSWERVDEKGNRIVCRGLDDAIVQANLADVVDPKINSSEIFIIGGGEIYRQALPLANKLYLTVVDTIIKGDTYFPEFDERNWNL